MRFRDRLSRFFYGRNGVDSIHYGLLVIFLVLWVLQMVFSLHNNTAVRLVLNIASWAIILYMLFRMLSRNITARRRESQKFSAAVRAVKNFFVLQKNKIRDIKSYRYKRCPGCRASLRLPRRRGSHTVVCPRCGKRFEVHIRI